MNTFAMVPPTALGYLAMDPHAPMPYAGSSRMISDVGAVFSPEEYGEVLGQSEAVSQALSPWDSGTRYLNFEKGKVDARPFFDEDTWRGLRALRTHWDPKDLFLATHEIQDL